MDRRDFLKTAGVGIVAAGAAAPTAALAKGKTYNWRMTTTWPPKSPVLMDACELFVKKVETMSGGRLKVQLFAGGELIPPLQTFEAVQQGTIQMGSSASYYWAGKVPEAQFFSTVPFGFNFQQMVAWLYHGGGLELWHEIYAPHGLIAFPMFNTGVQMGGWFRKEIKSLADLKGLKMRIPGLGGKILAKAGVNVTLLPAAEIYQALERGVIDATEWIGPFHDNIMGFYQAAKYYYYPGWHEPGTMGELIINKAAWDSLTPDLQEIIKCACAEITLWGLTAFESRNGAALQELIQKHGVKLRKFPKDVLDQLRKFSKEVYEEEAAKNPKFKKVYESFLAFQKKITPWAAISEKAFYDEMMG